MKMKECLPVSIVFGLTLPLLGRGTTDAVSLSTPASLLTHPFWASDTVVRESLLFVKPNESSAATAKLFFVPDEILDVHSATGERIFDPKVDFTWKPGSRELVLTATSAIPSQTLADMFPREAPNNVPMMPKKAPQGLGPYMKWAEGHVFHDLQVEVTYRHKDKWPAPLPASGARQLPRTLALLKAKKPVKLVVLGDSISAGYNASAMTQVKPGMPPYPSLVASGLESVFGSTVTMVNFSVGGMGVVWGVQRAPAVAQEKPDLVVIAFGMNDTSMARAEWAEAVKKLIDIVRQGAPEAEFILVSPMCGNPQWDKMRDEAFLEFRSSLDALKGPGIAVADVTSVWLELAKRKPYWDYTGNGLNHPNDFGHRLYAQVILALFAPAK